MYADTVTGSMERAISETERRRRLQAAYNEEHGITPMTIKKDVHAIIEATTAAEDSGKQSGKRRRGKETQEEITEKTIAELTSEMKKAAELLQFELAAKMRDEIKKLKGELK